MKKKIKFWTVRKKVLTFILGILSLISVVFFLHVNNNEEKAEKILVRAKEMINNLPESDDVYGFKRVFPSASIVSAVCENGHWKFKIEKGRNYIIVFILPKTQSDYKKSDGLENTIMATGSDPNSKLPVYVIINPNYLSNVNKGGVELDYLASCMLHESVHLYQRTLLMRKGLKESNELKDVIQREREAYAFQSKFIGQILMKNKIDKRIIVPNLSKEWQQKMTSSDLGSFCKTVNDINDGKLGQGLASLIVCDTYPDLYVSFVNMQYQLTLKNSNQ